MLSGARQSIVTYRLSAGSIIILPRHFAKDPQVKYIATTKPRSVKHYIARQWLGFSADPLNRKQSLHKIMRGFLHADAAFRLFWGDSNRQAMVIEHSSTSLKVQGSNPRWGGRRLANEVIKVETAS